MSKSCTVLDRRRKRQQNHNQPYIVNQLNLTLDSVGLLSSRWYKV